MKRFVPFLFAALIPMQSQAADKTVEDRLSDLEMKSDLNPITIKGQLIVRHDEITRNLNRGTAAAPNYKDVKFRLDRIRFYLDFNGDLSKRLSYYARLSASKQDNELFPVGPQNQDPINADQNGRAFRGADVYLERAYFNFKLLDSLVFSAGRLSIIDGPPYNLTFGEPPMGTYPLLSYQNNFDGYALSYAISDFTIRTVYHPISANARDTNSIATPAFGQNGRQMSVGDVKVLNVDYENKSIGFAKNFSAMAQYLFGDNIQIPDQKLALSPTGYGTSDLSFDVKSTTLYVEASGIAKTGLNVALTHTSTVVSSTGTIAQELLPVPGYGNIGVLTNLPKADTKGSAMHAVVSYDIPSTTLMDPTLGVEYFKPKQGFFFANANPLDPLRMLSTGGPVSHVFYVQPLDDYLKLRIGLIQTKPEFTNSIFGKSTTLSGDATKADKAMYAEMKVSF